MMFVYYKFDDLCLYFAERDAFDTLFDHAPDKLNVVKRVGTLYQSF